MGPQILDQDVVELNRRACRSVIQLHQLFTSALVAAVFQLELLRQLVLQIEQQPVFAPACQIVQTDTQRLQHSLGALQLASFGAADNALMA